MKLNMEICTNPAVLRIILFIDTLLDIVLFIIPIGLIVMLMIDFSKNVIAGKEDEMKKNVSLAIKRIIFCVIIFLIPTIVNFVNSLLGNLGVDYFQCLTNANIDYINNRVIEIAEEALEIAKQKRTMDSVFEAETAISEINDDSIKQTMKQQISNLKNTIKNELEQNNINNKDNNNNNESENYGPGTEGKYFAPVQNVKVNFGKFNKTAGCSNSKVSHDINGIDKGTPIYAGMDGTAEFKQTFAKINNKDVLISYGNQIKLTNSDGGYIIYAHLDSFVSDITALKKETCNYPCPASKYKGSTITVGKKQVKKGDLIGYLGSTGNSSGPHLHLEIHDTGTKNCVTDPWKAFGMR